MSFDGDDIGNGDIELGGVGNMIYDQFSTHIQNEGGSEQDSEQEIDPGDGDKRKHLGRPRLDLSNEPSSSVSPGAQTRTEAADRQRAPNPNLHMQRCSTAPARRVTTETHQRTPPSARVEVIQERPRPPPPPVKPPVYRAAECALLQCTDMDGLWTDAGSMQRIHINEEVILARGGDSGDMFRIFVLTCFVIVTSHRFIVKQRYRFLMFNFRTEEESYHYDNLQHVRIERGINIKHIKYGTMILSALIVVGKAFAKSGVVAFELLGNLIIYLTILAWIYGIILVLQAYNTNKLTIDMAKRIVVGTWIGKKMGSYITLTLPLPIDFCFEIMTELLQKHPLTPCFENQAP